MARNTASDIILAVNYELLPDNLSCGIFYFLWLVIPNSCDESRNLKSGFKAMIISISSLVSRLRLTCYSENKFWYAIFLNNLRV